MTEEQNNPKPSSIVCGPEVEASDRVCKEADGCPTEMAVLKRFWRRQQDILEASKGLRRIVEEIDGTMNHGTWRDERGMRLKDTPEWVAIYNALSTIQREKQ